MKDLNFGKTYEYTDELNKICDISKQLRFLKPESMTTWHEPAAWSVKYSNLRDKQIKALTITLTPTGCEWAKSGGCTMCGEFEGSQKTSTVSGEFHIAQFVTALSKYVKMYKPTWLRIEQEGNYSNENEVDLEAQLTMLRMASLTKGIKRITIEARPRYLNQVVVSKLKDAMFGSDVELEIGMGLEAENDVIRNVCINKGEDKKDFMCAVNLLNGNGLFPLAYILLKPPFLTEGEAIQEAINTIRYATKIGFKRISLEPMSLHKYTLVDALSNAGCYQVPWLWSVLEVIKECRDVPELGIGGVGYYPRPRYLSQNHHNEQKNFPDCNKIIWEALKKYSKYRNYSVFSNLNCSCKEKWRNECSKGDIPLKERINNQLTSINLNEYIGSLETNDDVAAENTIIIAGGSQLNYVRK